MNKLNHLEYLAQFDQTGVEPPLSYLAIEKVEPSKQHLPWLTYFSAALAEALTSPSTVSVGKVLTSNLSQHIKSLQYPSFGLSFKSPTQKNPFVLAIHHCLHRASYSNDFLEEGVKVLGQFIKNNLDEFRNAHSVEGITQLVRTLLRLANAEGVGVYENEEKLMPWGQYAVKDILPLCTQKEQVEFFKHFAIDCTSSQIDFSLELLKNFRIPVEKDASLYERVLSFAVLREKGHVFIPFNEVKEMLPDIKTRNTVIGHLLNNHIPAYDNSSLSEEFQRLDEFLSLLPRHELLSLLKKNPSILEKKQSPFLVSFWEKEQINQHLKKPLLSKIKKVLFASPKDSIQPKDSVSPSSPKPKKKM